MTWRNPDSKTKSKLEKTSLLSVIKMFLYQKFFKCMVIWKIIVILSCFLINKNQQCAVKTSMLSTQAALEHFLNYRKPNK